MKKLILVLLALCLLLPSAALADRMMVHISAVSADAAYIGKDWTSYWQLGEYQIFDGDVFDIYTGPIDLYAEITDNDFSPDVGSAANSFNVTDSRLQKGFSVSQEVYVTENYGRYRNYTATWYVTWTFTPVYDYLVLR